MKHIKMFESSTTPSWEVSSAKRKDGVAFNVGDTYQDMNDDEYTIKRMWISDGGKLMAEAEEGGEIDLFNVKLKKFVAK